MEKRLLGNEIKRIRNMKKISQANLAEGICSQSMLSFIESGKYIPNVQIILRICDRLGLSIDQLVLHDHYHIGDVKELRQRCEKLCDHHQYQELHDFLHDDLVISSIHTGNQLQAYYYYLACSQFHVKKDSSEVYRSFQLSLAESEFLNTSIGLLSLMGLAVLDSKAGKKEKAVEKIQEVMKSVYNVGYEKNLNILFYLQAYSYFCLNMLVDARKAIVEGVDFVTAHDSHYMLGNLFFLAAKIAEFDEKILIQEENIQKSKIFESLFDETIFQHLP